MAYLNKGIERTLLKRNRKVALLASIRAESCVPPHGMTKAEAITMLVQDIADFDGILSSLRRHGAARAVEDR